MLATVVTHSSDLSGTSNDMNLLAFARFDQKRALPSADTYNTRSSACDPCAVAKCTRRSAGESHSLSAIDDFGTAKVYSFDWRETMHIHTCTHTHTHTHLFSKENTHLPVVVIQTETDWVRDRLAFAGEHKKVVFFTELYVFQMKHSDLTINAAQPCRNTRPETSAKSTHTK